MKKWRYHSLLVRDLSIADSKLNSEGEKGWELVSVCLVDANTARCFFKQEAEAIEPIYSEPAYGALPEAVLVGSAPPFG
jgi:hypothetical protein